MTRLALRDWRNIASLQLRLHPRLVILWGENGAGKTNLLESIAVLATLKSFRGASWRQMVRWDAGDAAIAAEVQGDLGRAGLRMELSAQSGASRRILMDGEPVRDLTAYFQRLRAVVFAPDDTGIVRGEPERRRRFLDRAAFTIWPGHLELVRVFRRVLAQKAALLRSGRASASELEAWNQRLAPAGAQLCASRARAAGVLEEPLQRTHGILAGGSQVDLRYRSVLDPDAGTAVAELQRRYLRLLADARDEELRRGMNLVGPQRDDLLFQFAHEPGEVMRSARVYGSQGQVRTLALALKLAELDAARAKGETPLLLLDDLSSELDEQRMGRLVELIESLDAQVVVTTTDPGPVLRSAKADGQALRIRMGALAEGGD